MKGDSGAHMIGLLERRLDAIIFRAKFVPTVFAARQFINHGHIKVNGKRVNIAELPRQGRRRDRGQGKLEADGAGARSAGFGRARRARLHRSRRRKMTAKFTRIPVITDVPYAGADGAASGGRILFALTVRANQRDRVTTDLRSPRRPHGDAAAKLLCAFNILCESCREAPDLVSTRLSDAPHRNSGENR